MKTWVRVVAILSLVAAVLAVPAASEATVSGDNGKIAFVREVAEADQIFLIDADGRNETQITSFSEPAGDATRILSLHWSPDGRYLVFTRQHPGDPGSQPGIWTINPDGSGLTFIVAGSGGSPSPDGRSIAISEPALGQINNLPTSVISVVDLETGEKQVLTDPGDWVHEFRNQTSRDSLPVWTSDGTAIVFRRVAPGSASIHPSSIHIVDLASGDTEPVTGVGGLPHWSHDTHPTLFEIVAYVPQSWAVPGGPIRVLDWVEGAGDEIPPPDGYLAVNVQFGPDLGFAAELFNGETPEPNTVWAMTPDGTWTNLGEGRIPAWQPVNPYPVGLVDPTQGEWHLREATGEIESFYFGNPGDIPFMGDWDCNGTDTPGLYRQSDGYVYLRNSNTQGTADITFFFGNPGDVPIAGDFNGDNCDTVSIYRPSEARFYIINELGEDGGGLGAADYDFIFGNPADTPFIGDFDGDGIDTPGLHRPSTGLVYYRNTNSEGIADFIFYFGNPGDRFITGDWNHTGNDSPAVFRPSNTTFFFRHTNTQGNADAQFIWGNPTWQPVAGTFTQD